MADAHPLHADDLILPLPHEIYSSSNLPSHTICPQSAPHKICPQFHSQCDFLCQTHSPPRESGSTGCATRVPVAAAGWWQRCHGVPAGHDVGRSRCWSVAEKPRRPCRRQRTMWTCDVLHQAVHTDDRDVGAAGQTRERSWAHASPSISHVPPSTMAATTSPPLLAIRRGQ